jgi:hypothetical protein
MTTLDGIRKAKHLFTKKIGTQAPAGRGNFGLAVAGAADAALPG